MLRVNLNDGAHLVATGTKELLDAMHRCNVVSDDEQFIVVRGDKVLCDHLGEAATVVLVEEDGERHWRCRFPVGAHAAIVASNVASMYEALCSTGFIDGSEAHSVVFGEQPEYVLRVEMHK